MSEPKFCGFYKTPSSALMAFWEDGSVAERVDGRWVAVERISHAALFPDRVGVALWAQPHGATADPLPFRGDLPAQPRPDDADDREYPVRGGRDD